MKLNIDYETRSLVDLRRAGGYAYAAHPSTEILCMAWAFGDEEPEAWEPGMPLPERVVEHVRAGGDIWGWNSGGFERLIWNLIMVRRHGAPKLEREQVWDTAANAAAMALPRALGNAAAALGLEIEKDDEGRQLMLKMCKPLTIGGYRVEYRCGLESCEVEARIKKDAPKKCGCGERVAEWHKIDRVWWLEDRESRDRLIEYCKQDVRTEREVAKYVLPLSAFERRIYLLDQLANDRGVRIDVPLVDAAQRLADQALDEAGKQLERITEGGVEAVTEVGKIKEWVQEQGLDIDNLRKDTVRDLLADQDDDVPDYVYDVLQLRADAGKTSTGKLISMKEALSWGSRARGLLFYHAASTGRWAGRLIQPQNFPRPDVGCAKTCASALAKLKGEKARCDCGGIERFIPLVLMGAYDDIAEEAPVMQVISSLLRSMLRADRGKRFVAGDFAQIEARVLAWLAGQDDLVELFRSGGKIYETMAAFIFSLAVDDVGKDSFERQIGKNSILGCGFQMGPDRFAEQVQEQTGIVLERGRRWYCEPCDDLHEWEAGDGAKEPCPKCEAPMKVFQHEEDVAAKAVSGYRSLYAKIPEFWYALNDAAIRAVLDPGSTHSVGTKPARIRYTYRGQYLWCILPSGRKLAYALPVVRNRRLPEPYEDVIKPALSYVGVDSMTRQWRRTWTYGGHLTENVVQATARDLLASAMLRVEEAGYPVLLTVHDEILTEPDEDFGSVAEFENLMSVLPAWADGLPVAAEGWEGERYRK